MCEELFYFNLVNLLGDSELTKMFTKEIANIKNKKGEINYKVNSLDWSLGNLSLSIQINENEIKMKKKSQGKETNKIVRLLGDENIIILENLVLLHGYDTNIKTKVRYIHGEYEEARIEESIDCDVNGNLRDYYKESSIRRDGGVIKIISKEPENKKYFFTEDVDIFSKEIKVEKAGWTKIDETKTENYLHYKNPNYVRCIRKYRQNLESDIA